MLNLQVKSDLHGIRDSAASQARRLRCDMMPNETRANTLTAYWYAWLQCIPHLDVSEAGREWTAMYPVSGLFRSDLAHGGIDVFPDVGSVMIVALVHATRRNVEQVAYLGMAFDWLVSDPSVRSMTRGGGTPAFGSAFSESKSLEAYGEFFGLLVRLGIGSAEHLRDRLRGHGHDGQLTRLIPDEIDEVAGAHELLSLHEAADLLGIRKSSFANKVARGEIPPQAIVSMPGRHRRFRRSALASYKRGGI